MYSFNVVLGFLDELLALKESIKHGNEAGLGFYFHTNNNNNLYLNTVVLTE